MYLLIEYWKSDIQNRTELEVENEIIPRISIWYYRVPL